MPRPFDLYALAAPLAVPERNLFRLREPRHRPNQLRRPVRSMFRRCHAHVSQPVEHQLARANRHAHTHISRGHETQTQRMDRGVSSHAIDDRFSWGHDSIFFGGLDSIFLDRFQPGTLCCRIHIVRSHQPGTTSRPRGTWTGAHTCRQWPTPSKPLKKKSTFATGGSVPRFT